MIYKGVFITGTDTDVGKTYIGAQIAAQLHESQIDVIPRKPIESGCEYIDGVLHPSDANHYYDAINKTHSLAEICPYRFEPAISPQRAARLVNQPISTDEAYRACTKNVTENNFLIVEGAGGFYSPLCEGGLNADLAKSLQLPVLLVAEDRLGCINQILLTAQAIEHYELELCAIVLNNMNTSGDKAMDNFEDLKSNVSTDIFSIDQDQTFDNSSPLINHLLKLT